MALIADFGHSHVPRSYDPLPFQFGLFETEKEGKAESRYVQGTEHLGDMGIIDTR